MELTVASHYNPCFWTAHWNPAYLKAAQEGPSLPSPRNQVLRTLNIYANKILPSKTQDAHFSKNGTLRVSKEEAKRTCELWMPDNYQQAWDEIDASSGDGYAFHVEALHSHLEQSTGYEMLKKVVRKGTLSHTADKVNLAWAIVMQHMRNPEILRAIGDVLEANGRKRFELFLSFARLLNNASIVLPTVQKLANSKWEFYKTYTNEFPLADAAVLVEPNNWMIALSPRLLLELHGGRPETITSTKYFNTVPPAKMDEFRRRSIGNTFKEIIFSDDARLQEWKDAPEFAARRQAILDKTVGYPIP